MDNEPREADYSRVVIGQAAKVIVVADHTKFDRRAFVKVCWFDEIDTLITSDAPPPGIRSELDAAGVEVLIV